MPDPERPQRPPIQFGLRGIFIATVIAGFAVFFLRSLGSWAMISPPAGLLFFTGAFLIRTDQGDSSNHAFAFAFGILASAIPYSLLLLALHVPNAAETAEIALAGSALLAVLGWIPFYSTLEILGPWLSPRHSLPAKGAAVAFGLPIGLIVLACGNRFGPIATLLLLAIVPAVAATALAFLFRRSRPVS